MAKIQEPRINPVIAALLVLFTSFMLYQFVGGLFVYFLAGADITDNNAPLVRIISTISQIFFLLAVPILAAKLFYNDFNTTFRIKKLDLMELSLSAVGMILVVSGLQFYVFLQTNLINYLSGINPAVKSVFDTLINFDKVMQNSYEKIFSANNYFDLLSVTLAVALTPAFCEEFLFRGFVQNSLEQKIRPSLAIVITGFIFGLFHFNLISLLPLVLIGVYLGYIAYKTENIFVAVVLHFLNNFATIILYFYIKKDWMIESTPKTDITSPVLFAGMIVNFILLYIVMFYLNKYVRNKNIIEGI